MFKVVNGVHIFDNGVSRIWRCRCGVWTRLERQGCCCCDRKRADLPSDQPASTALEIPTAA